MDYSETTEEIGYNTLEDSHIDVVTTPLMFGAVPSYGITDSIHSRPVCVEHSRCPKCYVGVVEESYPLGAICFAILLFPFGLLCCLAMKELKCSHCGLFVE